MQAGCGARAGGRGRHVVTAPQVFDTTTDPEWRRQVKELFRSEGEKSILIMRNVLDALGMETIGHLRSLTSELRPPAVPGEPDRRAHPGHWADITSVLAASYGHAVWPLFGGLTGEQGIDLALYNSAEYASALDAKDGYYVLQPVLEKGGYAYDKLDDLIGDFAPYIEVEKW